MTGRRPVWVVNEPRMRTGPWGQMLLPLDPPLELDGGDVLEVEVGRDVFSDGAPGWIAWRARSRGREVRGHEFAGFPAALEGLYPSDHGPEGPGPDEGQR